MSEYKDGRGDYYLAERDGKDCVCGHRYKDHFLFDGGCRMMVVSGDRNEIPCGCILYEAIT